MSELKKLADYISNFSYKDAPKTVVEAARFCVLDTIGVAISASQNQLVKGIYTHYSLTDGASEFVSVWGYNKKASLRTATFINGLMGHVMELDDVHIESKTHIGAVVVPAAWSLAEYLGKSGEELLEAVICGYETMARIGMGFGVSSHRNKGWHVTGTAGTFGAAAACAKLLKLDTSKTLSALGLAGTQSCGLWAFLEDGATCKILHPARAALSGLESALLAEAGMTGPEHILDAKDGGLYPAASEEYNIEFVTKDLGKVYEILKVDKKPYPCCRSTHCAIDAALALCSNNNLDSDNINSITVNTYLVGYKQCGATETSLNPVLPSDAKFSTSYTVSLAILKGKVDVQDFTPEAITSKATRDLMKKVRVVPDKRFTSVYPNHWGCEMIIEDIDGHTYSKIISDASGSVDSPLTKAQIINKISYILEGYSEEEIQSLVNTLLSIDTQATIPLF